MLTISFRAECGADVVRFEEALARKGIAFEQLQYLPDEKYPDVELEYRVDATLKRTCAVMQTIEDGHVMVDTLQNIPLNQNPLRR